MDKFVVRSSRNQAEKPASSRSRKQLKQVTIKSLSRVVNIDELKALKSLLDNTEASPSELVGALEELKPLRPSREILLSVKVGHSINRLRKHSNLHVKRLAVLILKDWKKFYKELRNRQPIDVTYDLKTESTRKQARHLVAKALGLQTEGAGDLSSQVEKWMFQKSNCRPDTHFKQSIRKLCLSLQNQTLLREGVLNGTLSIPDLHRTVIQHG